MPVPSYSAAALLGALQRLLPRGRVWSRDPDSVQAQVLGSLMPIYARQSDHAAALLVDCFPATSVELLPEWEATLRLPDPCAGPEPTIALRQAQVVARLTNTGGQSVPYFVGYAATLGFPVTITEYAPARADLLCADEPVYDPAWAHYWLVTAAGVEVTYFVADDSYADEPLAAYGSTVLSCELGRLKPAHTTVSFSFGG